MKASLNHELLAQRYEEIRAVYEADARPWVVGFSGGKDSTCALQMVWTALSELPPERRSKPVYVISSDTLTPSKPFSRNRRLATSMMRS